MSPPDPQKPRRLEDAPDLGGINEERKARIFGMYTDNAVRVGMAFIIGVLFIVLNVGVIILIQNAFNADISLIREGLIQGDQRLITEKVFMSLIGATVVQVGVALVAITRYLFPERQQ